MTTLYNNFKELLLNGGVDLDTDTIQMALISDSIAYTPDPDNEVFVADVLDDVNASELSGTGYARQTLNISASQDNANDQGVLDADDVTLSGLNAGTIASALIFKEVTNDADSPLIGHYTSSEFPMPTNGGDVTIQIDAAGLLTLG